MGLLDREYMKEPNKPSKRRKVKANQPNRKTKRLTLKSVAKTKKRLLTPSQKGRLFHRQNFLVGKGYSVAP
jgi:hypothetical protein